MSALQKSVLKSKLPPISPLRYARWLGRVPNTTEHYHIARVCFKSEILKINHIAASIGANKRMAMRKRDYTPVEWSKYFEKSEDIKVGNDSFRVYTIGETGPALVLLHGGGLSALGWSLFAVAVSKLVNCRIVAIDLRGHGSTRTADDFDLSSATLVSDVVQVLANFLGKDAPPVVLMGHSMGGAIAVHTAVARQIETLAGLVVIDVVEGTAMDALSSMQSFLRGRPKAFTTMENAIEWCVRGSHVRNVDSAKVSMPGQIMNIETGDLAINDIASHNASSEETSSPMVDPNQILEDSEEEQDQSSTDFKTPLAEPLKPRYKWRIDLTKTEKHWNGWFSGMSKLFLSVDEPKLLILAGIDTLDKELMVGQMQGKFQLQVLPQCGHAVHEDVPDRVAELLATFLVRYKLVEPTTEFINHSLPQC